MTPFPTSLTTSRQDEPTEGDHAMPKIITTTTTTTVIGAPGEAATDTAQHTTDATVTSVTVYRLDELSDQAQERAVEKVREQLYTGFAEHDRADIAVVIVCTLAEKLGTPGRGECGVYDFPSIDGVSLDGWSLDRASIALSGTLTRENAPALPWIDSVGEIKLLSKGSDYTIVRLVDVEPPCTCPTDAVLAPHEPDCPSLRAIVHDMTTYHALDGAALEAIKAALEAGEAEWEHRTSTESARDRAEIDDYEFTADGDLYR